MAKKDVDMKKVQIELTKAQIFVTEYLMKEDELVRERGKAKEEVESMQKVQGKHTMEVNSQHHRLKYPKNKRKDEVTVFEQQLQKLRQELKDG